MVTITHKQYIDNSKTCDTVKQWNLKLTLFSMFFIYENLRKQGLLGYSIIGLYKNDLIGLCFLSTVRSPLWYNRTPNPNA